MRKYLIYPIKQYIFKFFTFLCCGVGCIYYITQIEEALQAGFWDVLFFLFRGQREYNPVSRQPFIPPFFWIIIQSTLIYCSVFFLSGKLSPYETQILIRMRKRKKWWREKIAAAILYTSMTYLILWAGIAASCLVSGQKLGNQGLASLYGMGNLSVSQNILVLMVQPFLTTLSFAFLFMVLHLILEEKTVWILMEAILFFSAFLTSVLLIGNHAMALRSSAAMPGGIETWQAAVTDIIVILLCWITGERYVNRMDWLGKQKEN